MKSATWYNTGCISTILLVMAVFGLMMSLLYVFSPIRVSLEHRVEPVRENRAIMEAIERHATLDEIKEIVKQDPSSIGVKYLSGLRPIYFVADSDRADVLEFLLAKGVDADEVVSKKDSVFYGETPMHFALPSHRLENIRVLKKYGARGQSPYPDVESALEMAERLGFSDCVQAISE